jgi:hypothetical protein
MIRDGVGQGRSWIYRGKKGDRAMAFDRAKPDLPWFCYNRRRNFGVGDSPDDWGPNGNDRENIHG